VIGVGGYAAFPALAAAVLRRRPIVLLEQNALAGLVTRLFAPFARAICVSFAETAERLGPRARVTGNPVRWKPRGVPPPGTGALRVLVFGGSAGAHRLNQIAPGALARLGGSVRVLHQTGAADQDDVRGRYRELGLDAEVVTFVEDMRRAYEECDVAVCRSGATTIAELTAMGVAAVLVPYPFAAADHQRTNAEALVRAGAAWMLLDRDLDETTLAACLEEARADPAGLAERRRRARALGRPDAIDRVVDVCLGAAAESNDAAPARKVT
jgi:UDP-N-acetylglucosamine--N-acetylmuramyl-(pentapeptide) pyrophosphoryl-undecaprenol N-acetylglucosamine transferase